MNRILNAIKCAICNEILESPVILQCSCNICYKHVKNQNKDFIQCEKCGVEHQIPTNGFHANIALQVIIEAEIANLDFGSIHKEAKISCESFEKALKELDNLLKDPYFYAYQKINELKNSVQLGEELKLRIEEVIIIIDRLEEYEKESKEYLSSNEFKEESKRLENELKVSQLNLNSWIESLNKIKLDDKYWKSISIKEESDKKLKCITDEIDKFKNKLLLNKFEENQVHVNFFQNIKNDCLFEYNLANKSFSVSRIVNVNLFEKFEELLKKKDLNGRKWTLLYQGSLDGFGPSDFHSLCDSIPNTLTIVKSTSGNIFGGFTSVLWNSFGTWQHDKSAFIFSLVNKENRPLIFEHSSSDINSIVSYPFYCPTFGKEHEFHISNFSNTNRNSCSNIGKTYTHPEYPFGSHRAKTILAGTEYFQVQEIEVFQLQH